MIRNFDPKSDPFLTALAGIEARIAKASREISSGLKVERPSDSPEDVAQILLLQQKLSHSQQFRKNLDTLKAETSAADGALQQTDQVLNSILSLGLQGAGSSGNSVQQRPILAKQVRQLQETLVNLASTQSNGRYVFSGDADQAASYRVNSGSPTGVDRLIDSPASRMIQDSSGTTFAPSLTAQEIFDLRLADDTPAQGNVFAAVQKLATALENNDAAGIDAALSSLREGRSHVSTMLSHYGAIENRLTTATDLAQKFEVDGAAALSKLSETDIAEASTALAQSQVQREAAMSVQSNVRRNSLFDYLR